MAKILVVEDDPNNAEIVTRILKMKNYEVVTASDGPRGVALAEQERPDLILMDMKMPNYGDGQRATRDIRSCAGLQRVPIIALTAQGMPQEIDEMVQAGCNDIITKPVNLKQLLEKIATFLTRSNP